MTLATLGTMTFGRQNTEAEAHDQLDLAIERGVNLVDAAEMYPVPADARTHGLTERFVGTWLAKGPRGRAMVATKVTGPGRNIPRFGGWKFDPAAEVPAPPVEEQLGALDRLVRAGKVRWFGLSNETPWGVMAFLDAAREHGLARVASVQNSTGISRHESAA